VVGEQRFLRPLLGHGGIESGQRVLDTGCGTGMLAIMVKRAQPGADVVGLDMDAQVLQFAAAKARRAATAITFHRASAAQLPYQDKSIDRVLTRMMLHHLTTRQKKEAAPEIQRVLKPGGQLHARDFGNPTSAYGRFVGWLLHRFEHIADNLDGHLPGFFEGAGLRVVETRRLLTAFGSPIFLRGHNA
jgi:ubiquinone/menaquinone biosynthesis C-methylase UbiE